MKVPWLSMGILLGVVLVTASCSKDRPTTRTCPDRIFADLCRPDDGDVPGGIPAHNEIVRCRLDCRTDVEDPLFADAGALPADFHRVHRVCRLLDPAPGTRDHADSRVRQELRSLLRVLLRRPALARVVADLPDAEARLEELERIWLGGNAFEHVICGEVNTDGTVGGMHLWSEYLIAEREGRADYLCSHEGLSDEEVATVRYTWRPRAGGPAHLKPVGGFHVGMSPACLLAVGTKAVRRRCAPSRGVTTAFKAELYGRWVDWVLWNDDRGRFLTLFPLAADAKGAR